MVYEVRFQTVDPKRRADYVKMYKEAIQGCKAAGYRSGLVLCSEEDPAAVMGSTRVADQRAPSQLARHSHA